MLEASGFDFRNRYPQRLLLKVAKAFNVDRKTVGKTAYNMSLDLYRTFAPLKQTTPTMAFACIELAGRVSEQRIPAIETGENYERWKITRQEVMGLFFGSSTVDSQPYLRNCADFVEQKRYSTSWTCTLTIEHQRLLAKITR